MTTCTVVIMLNLQTYNVDNVFAATAFHSFGRRQLLSIDLDEMIRMFSAQIRTRSC